MHHDYKLFLFNAIWHNYKGGRRQLIELSFFTSVGSACFLTPFAQGGWRSRGDLDNAALLFLHVSRISSLRRRHIDRLKIFFFTDSLTNKF